MEAFLNKYPFYKDLNVVVNGVTYDPVNRRDAFIFVDSVTGEPYRPDIYSEGTMLKLLAKNNPTDPYTRRPVVVKRGVEGAVIAKRAPKELRKLIESLRKNKVIPEGAKTKRVPKPLPLKVKKSVRVTMYRAEGRGSWKNGCRINNDPFVTPWAIVRRSIMKMVVWDIETKVTGRSYGLHNFKDSTKEDLMRNMKRIINNNIVRGIAKKPVFNDKGVYTKVFTRKMFELGHESLALKREGNVGSKTMESLEKALVNPRSKTIASKIPLPSTRSSNN